MVEQTYALAESGAYGQSNGLYTNSLEAIPDSVIARYEFESTDDTGTAVDSVGSNNLTLSGPTYTTDSQEGNNALEFDGTGYAEVPPFFDESAEWTVVGWVKPSDLSSRMDLFTNRHTGNTPYFEFRIDGALEVANMAGNNYVSSFNPTTGEYQMVGFAYNGDGTGTIAYNDQTQSVSGHTFENFSDSYGLGARPEDWGDTYIGIMDEWRIHDTALSSSEFQQFYDKTM